ncbi:hypothetical protein LWI29_034402 [Acer saccharum]|uniref:Elongator complex protein 6 n=1 Tax=Acer saccharum TaxID=4024 RepID=A0AA39VW29_ACESA|nr:hypothetical protein LWI29_034402 [Acer saccharum]
MNDNQSLNLLDRALGLDQQSRTWPLSGRVVLIEDCVETTASFVLHHLIKRSLSPNSSNVIVFVAFANPFSHYDRVLRKLGCNLVTQRDNNRFFSLICLCCSAQMGMTEKAKLDLFHCMRKFAKLYLFCLKTRRATLLL